MDLNKMYSKAVLSFGFVLLLLISYSIFIGTVDLRSYFLPQLQSRVGAQSLCTTNPNHNPPLRVYMYDLPRRFNVGMINRRSSDQTPVTVRTWPPWPSNSGLKRQHSVEYWMMGSLLYESQSEGEDEREAIKVSDPEMADAFFVPFFSSLSFNTHGHNMTDPKTEIDHQLQIDLMKFLSESKYWKRSGGRDHVIPMTHPNAFRFLRAEVNASIQIVVDFGRYPKTMSNLRKDVVAPYVHVVDSFADDDPPDPFDSRTTLLFFRGRTFRKDEGIVRVKLAKILADYEDVHYERSVATGENIKAFLTVKKTSGGSAPSIGAIYDNMLAGMLSDYPDTFYHSRTRYSFARHYLMNSFILPSVPNKGDMLSCFEGDTPSSCRLFDAIVSHCVPVIVSDQIELPFEDEIDYSKFSIFYSFKEALEPGYMVNQLREFPKEKWMEMWRQLKNISHHFEFRYPPKKEDAVNMLWRQVKHKLPGVKLAAHRSRRMKIPDWWQRRR